MCGSWNPQIKLRKLRTGIFNKSCTLIFFSCSSLRMSSSETLKFLRFVEITIRHLSCGDIKAKEMVRRETKKFTSKRILLVIRVITVIKYWKRLERLHKTSNSPLRLSGWKFWYHLVRRRILRMGVIRDPFCLVRPCHAWNTARRQNSSFSIQNPLNTRESREAWRSRFGLLTPWNFTRAHCLSPCHCIPLT